jgi:tRNA isopentenyl-2-thiomethyl-A-37 hydroxylase MiaE
LTKVAPSSEITPHRQACDKAFALVCRYSGGRDLVEEMVATKF